MLNNKHSFINVQQISEVSPCEQLVELRFISKIFRSISIVENLLPTFQYNKTVAWLPISV